MKRMKEKHPHGDTLFPFEFFDQSRPKDNYVVYVHWHPEVEWVFVLEGKVQLTVDSKKLVLEAGDFAAIEPHCLHYMYSLEACRYCTCVFDKRLLELAYTDRITSRYIQPYLENALYVPEPVSALETEIPALYKEISHFIKARENGYELAVRLALFRIFLCFIQQGWLQERNGSEKNIEAIDQVLAHIHEHYAERLTSQGLAETIRYNPQYFSRFFKECTGFSPIEYVNRYRVDQACRLLVDPNRSVLSVSLECGYESCSYFIRKFKAYKNVSPSEFRHQLMQVYAADYVE